MNWMSSAGRRWKSENILREDVGDPPHHSTMAKIVRLDMRFIDLTPSKEREIKVFLPGGRGPESMARVMEAIVDSKSVLQELGVSGEGVAWSIVMQSGDLELASDTAITAWEVNNMFSDNTNLATIIKDVCGNDIHYNYSHDCQLDCLICKETFNKGEKVTEVSCGHSYHTLCLSTWTNTNSSCPLCRTPIPIAIN